MNKMQLLAAACLLSAGTWLSGCRTSSYQLTEVKGGRIEVTSALDANPDSVALAILAPYKAKVDSVMSPVVGVSDMYMEAGRPESLLSNLVADVLRRASYQYPGHEAEVGLVNVGGLRAPLPAGDITYGRIYQILPFENSLSIVEMTGTQLLHLLQNIVTAGGEGISGARIGMRNGELLYAYVGGYPLDENRVYRVATIDYLSEGNDGMTAFKEVTTPFFQPEGATLRKIFLDYVSDRHRWGLTISSALDGRIAEK